MTVKPWMWTLLGAALVGTGVVLAVGLAKRQGYLAGAPSFTALRRALPAAAWKEVRPSTYGMIASRAEAQEIKRRLEAHGFEPVIAPMGHTAAQVWVKAS